MTTIACRDKVMAADSCATSETESGGSIKTRCVKIFRTHGAIIGLAGESGPGLVFLRWYGSGNEPPELLASEGGDFTALVLTRTGLWEFDKWCQPERVLERSYAIGSGAQAAMGAMAMGANARTAVKIAAKIDPYTGGKIVTMTL